MKNRYVIKGEVTHIFLNSRKYGEMVALVDTEELQRICEFPNSWHPNYHPSTKSFYVVGNMPKVLGRQKKVKLHRWIMQERNSDVLIDHINHDPLDNRKNNLRVCTVSENSMNSRKMKVGLSKFKGVSYHKHHRVYTASIQVNNKPIFLGYFTSEYDAALAYNQAAIQYFGEYANINKIKRLETAAKEAQHAK